MNSRMIQILPVMALALGLSACSSDETRAPAPSVPEVTAGARIDTTFQADCGGQPSAAVTSNYDISSCQLSNQQMALLRGVGPFSVAADCTQKSVEVRNAAGEISGSGAIEADGTYNVELQAGQSFSVLEGCPVNLAGRATGSVVCKAQEDGSEKVESVTINTAFNFASVALEGSAVTESGEVSGATAPAASLGLASELDSERVPGGQGKVSPLPKGKQPLPIPTLTPVPPKGKWPHPHPRPTVTATPAAELQSATSEEGDDAAADTDTDDEEGDEDGDDDELNRRPIPIPTATPPGKGGKLSPVVPLPLPKGKQGPSIPTVNVEGSCVNFAPCVFNSSATLSCGQ